MLNSVVLYLEHCYFKGRKSSRNYPEILSTVRFQICLE